MHPSFWHERWQTGQTGFHQFEVNPHLAEYWPHVGLQSGQRIFVPLCGKSLDMRWLAERGHRIVGNELSGIAVREFFVEAALEPAIEPSGDFKRWSAGDYEVFEGDFFALGRSDLGSIDAVYDRAALVALPPDMRPRYAAKISALIEPRTPMLLVTMNYDPAQMAGPPFAVAPEDVEALYRNAFEIQTLATTDALPANPRFQERGLTWLEESAWLLRRRAV